MSKAYKSTNNQHVLPRSDGWAVKKEGAVRDTKVFNNQSQAIGFATKVAKNNHSEVFIHAKDGRIRERNTYGHDPHPPKG